MNLIGGRMETHGSMDERGLGITDRWIQTRPRFPNYFRPGKARDVQNLFGPRSWTDRFWSVDPYRV